MKLVMALAALLSDAAADFGEDKRQRLVVRSAPVHRSVIMEEEADLSKYSAIFAADLYVIEALKQHAQLTEAELAFCGPVLTCAFMKAVASWTEIST